LRPYIQESVSSAIDLALLRKLADGLGKHARPVFQRYFLSPAAQDNPEIQDLFAKVLEIDEAGTFVAVFLEEINLLGETLYTTGDQGDKTHHLIEFLEYLLAEARREEDEHIRLGYISRQFKVGIILLALSYRAHREGITPYLRRLNDYIKLGCDSIYIIAYPQAFDFLKRILDAVDGDDRVSLVKTCRVKTKSFADHSYEARKIALFRPRPLFSDSSFEEKVKAMGIENGSRIDAEVFDISRNFAMVDAKGLNGIIRRQDCSWRMVSSCQDLLALGKKYQFIVTSIDPSRSLLKLSLRDPDQDPWKSDRLPELGDVVEVQIVDCNGFCYTGLYEDDIEICIPRYELSWTETPPPDSTDLLNTTQKVVIYEKSDQAQELKGSLRQLEEDPWPNIHQRLPKGTELRGTVAEVNPHFVRVNLPDGLQGIIPSEAMVKAGFEYADYQKNVVVGQGLDVVVTKVFLKKKKIRLDLKRNLPDQTD
jgi:predicted RNA-binding protein with RPS1 domain